jgi:anthranilate synthase/phosphoribosyltransferase
MILLIDNFDSFTYNIYQYLREIKTDIDVVVKRNNVITIKEIEEMKPTHIIISPGPGHPENAGISIETVKKFTGLIPILGICLGHQAIGAAFGGNIGKATTLYHGKASTISHDGKGVFNGIQNPFSAIRYHSLAIEKISLPDELEITAVSGDGDIMGVRHKIYNVEGVQFHPESIGTSNGKELLLNFIVQKREKFTVQTSIKKVHAGQKLSEEEARQVMEDITSGNATPAQIAGILTALSLRNGGESVQELTGFARVMRQKATPIQKPEGIKVVDTCGTGGDTSGTFNISTIAAFVAAGSGVTIAKHGNRSVTSRCGSADVLEALGVNVAAPPEIMSDTLQKIGISFLFAPRLHSSMKHAVPVRQQLGIRTVFNILGPLSNPAGADYQLLGVFSNDIREKVAQTLVNLGIQRAMVVHGSDGLDEITLTGKTFISEIKDGWIKDFTLDPHDFGINYCTPEELKGGELKTNAEIAYNLLRGEKGPKRDIVLLNAAAAIYLSDITSTLPEAIEKARHSIDSGAAIQKLNHLVRLSCGAPIN